MKNKKAIEAYKLQSFDQKRQEKGAEQQVTGDEKTRPKPALPQEDHPAEGEIYRGSRINSILDTDGFFKTGYAHKRAAKLLLLLGKEQAAAVLKHLSEEEVEKVTAEIAKIKRIEREEARKILQDFGSLADKIAATPRGGIQVARDMLSSALGEAEAEKIIGKVSPYAENKPFAFLNDLDYQQIMLLLRKEPVHVMSIVVSYLEPRKASQVIESLPPEVQAQVVKRIARMGQVSPEVLSSIEESLRERIRTQGKVVAEEIDGQSVLADILKHMPLNDENRILESLEEKNRELAEHIRERLFNFETVLEIPDSQLQGFLYQYPDRDLAVILKGKSPELEDKVLRNVSQRRRDFIQQERESLGPMRRSEVDRITKDFLSFLRERAERGELTLDSDELV